MRTIYFILLCLCTACSARAEKMVRFYNEDVNGKTHEPYFFFIVGDFKKGSFSGPCGPSDLSCQWAYHVTVEGSGDHFGVTQISIRQDSGTKGEEFHPVSGEISVDRKKKMITIDLKIDTRFKVEDFQGNGTFKIEKGL